MRLRLIVLLVCVLAARAAEAQTYLWFEPQVAIDRLKPVELVSESWATDMEGKINQYQRLVEKHGIVGEYFGNLSFGHQWSPWLGIFFQSAHGNFWGETAAGPQFAIGPELQIGIGIGIEHFEPKPLRLRLNAYYDHTNTGSFIYAQYDIGKDSSWIWADATRMHKWFGYGVLLQMPDAGVGPKLELRAGEHLGFWIAPVYDWQAGVVRTLVGSRIMWER